MVSAEELTRLSKLAYENAHSKGWWETEREPEEVAVLIMTELAEAFEDYRASNMGLTISESGKPVGFDSEMADVVIRILDMYGRFDKNIDLDYDDIDVDFYQRNRSISWWMFNMMENVSSVVIPYEIDDEYKDKFDFNAFNFLLEVVILFCEQYKIDIMKAIEVKMSYNKSRPYRHGGKKA